jgi:RHS repeat-associated protein
LVIGLSAYSKLAALLIAAGVFLGLPQMSFASGGLGSSASSLRGGSQGQLRGVATDNAHRSGELTSVKPGWLPSKRASGAASASALTSAASPTTPFTECPAIGGDTSCGILIDVTESGISILQDPSQGPYDGSDDTLVGVLNQSSKTLGHLSLASNTYIFGFDGDGICSGLYGTIAGCPFGPTGYEGPGTSFIEISPDEMSGVVSFSPGIAPGGSAYFSLEEPLTSSTVVSGGPSPTEQGGAPNRSEKHSTCSNGSPVNCATGVFWHEFTDANIPGRGVPLDFNRTYSSMNAETNGPLGFGWTDSYNMSLSIDSETGAGTIYEEGGSSVTFPSNGEGGFTTPPRVLATLTNNEDGTYTFSRYSDHINYVFSESGELLREVDRNGNTTTLTYSGGQLEKVTDPSGRSLTFAYSGSHLHTITDPVGRTTTFAYDGSGNLKEATDPMGRTWTFTYDSQHRLLTMTDPRGGTTSNTYDSSGRVIAQVDPMGRELTWSYEGDPTSPEGGTTIFTDGRGNETAYEYENLELVSVSHGFGTAEEATTYYRYDPITLGITSIIDPDGNETRNSYDSHGNLIETTDPMYRTSYYYYGSMDELLYASDPRGTYTYFRYDGNGNLLEKETPLYETGETVRTTYSYEAAPGEVTAVTDPNGHTAHFGYDSAGDCTSVTDADGNETTYGYNADGEQTSMVSPAGNEAGGNPADHTTSYVYNADGELTGETDPLGHSTTYTYDGNGNRISVTDANGHTTHQTYDADNELIEVERPDGSVLKTEWDAAGNMIAQIDAAGHKTAYGYDALNRLTSTTDPDGHTTSYVYDPAGNKIESINPEGQATEYEYDEDGELTAIYYSDGTTPDVYEEYDEDGNRIELEDGTGTSTFTYDELDRLTSATDGSGETTSYQYDLAGNLTKLTYPNDQSVTRSYDAAGNLTSVTDWLGHTSHFSYDADSNLKKEQYANGVTAQLGYDNADRLGSITDSNGGDQLASFTYTRDAAGQVTNEATENGESTTTSYTRNSLDQLTAANSTPYGYDAADNPTTFGAETTQHFDAANELTSAVGPGEAPEEPVEEPKEEEKHEEGQVPPPGGGSSSNGSVPQPSSSAPSPPGPTPASSSRKKHRIHCRKGFKKKKIHGKIKCVKFKKKRHRHSKHRRASASAQAATISSAASPPSSTGSVSSADRSGASAGRGTAAGGAATGVTAAAEELVTRNFAYNERGDRISEGVSGGPTRTLAYDQADRLIGVNGNITYAYNGDGLRTSKTVNDITTHFVWNQAEALPELLQAESLYYIYGPEGRPIEQIEGSTATYLQEDQQGSIRLLTNASGNAVGRYDYDAWGNVLKHTGSATSNLQYDGQYTDAETGYQYLRFRYYDPSTGQFLTRDPAVPVSRMAYGFASMNPTDSSDPLGLWGWNPISDITEAAGATTHFVGQHWRGIAQGVAIGAGAVGATACIVATAGICGGVIGTIATVGVIGGTTGGAFYGLSGGQHTLAGYGKAFGLGAIGGFASAACALSAGTVCATILGGTLFNSAVGGVLGAFDYETSGSCDRSLGGLLGGILRGVIQSEPIPIPPSWLLRV